MSEKQRYRLKQYSATGKAWQLDVEKINSKTGEARWVTIKYPGNIQQAAETAVALELGDNFAVESLNELIDAVQDATEKVIAAMQAFGEDVVITVDK